MSRKKQNVLDEDSYGRNIASIIERDFFPDTELLAVENAYLEAESQNDFETMKNLTVRKKQLAGRTPATARTNRGVHDSVRSFVPNTPLEGNKTPEKGDDDGEENVEEEKWNYESEDPTENPTVTLNGYLSKNTSEDNYNYHKVLRDLDQKKHLAKYRWVYELDNKHRKYVPYATCDSGLGIAAKTKLREEAEKKMIEEKQAMLALGYGEDEIDKTDGDKATEDMTESEKHDKAVELAIKSEDRSEIQRADASLYKAPKDEGASKILNNWRYMSKNNVMFYREAIGSKFDDGKFKKPQMICFENTRFKEKDPYAKQLERMRIEKAAKAASAYKQGSFQKDGSVIAADGSTTDSSSISSMGRSQGPGGKTPAKISGGFLPNMPLTSSDGTPLRTPMLTPNGTSLGSAMTADGSGYVPSTPMLTPGRGPDESPLMTWGTLGNTPVALTPQSGSIKEPSLSYTVPQITKREAVAEKLTEKLKSRERSKKNKAVHQAKKSIFGQTPDRIGSILSHSQRSTLSPAAQNLMNSGALSGRGSSRRTGMRGTPLVKVNKRGVNETPTPGGGGGGMLAAKLNKLSKSSDVTGGLI